MSTKTEITSTRSEQLAASERFTNAILQEFGSNVAGAVAVTDFQKRLIQGYFVAIDAALKVAEEDRVRKNERNTDHSYDNMLPITWQNVNMTDLATDLVHYARVGLDMQQKNMLFPIPYKNNKRNCYDITLMPGYNGIRYIATKYALESPRAVTIEVVYSNDEFKPIKKDANHVSDNYKFNITDAFDRGKIVGGFAYIEFADITKNRLIIMSMADIDKRKPQYASANFWGGTVKSSKSGKASETEVEGWLKEMVEKTIIREAYSEKNIPIDPKKIDDDYQFMKIREAQYAEMQAQAEIDSNANTVVITADGEVKETTTTQPQIAAPATDSTDAPGF